MQQPVQDRRGDDLIAEDLAPVHERLVRGEDGAGPLVAPVDQAEEQAGFLAGHRQVAHLIEYQHLGIGQLLELPVQTVLLASAHQRADQPIQGHEQHPVAGLGDFHRQGDGEMCFPDAGRAVNVSEGCPVFISSDCPVIISLHSSEQGQGRVRSRPPSSSVWSPIRLDACLSTGSSRL